MKVLFIIRATAFQKPGGDTIQAKMSAKYLRVYGIEADLKLTDEVIDYSNYQLMHFFNIIRPADILKHVKQARLSYVISPVFMDYREYERRARGGVIGLMANFLSVDFIEFVKVLARSIKNKEKIQSRYYLFHGHRQSIRYLIKNCQMLLPNSESEIQRLFGHYKSDQSYHIVPNGIDEDVFNQQERENKREGVICVAQIEGRKNQLNLIRAMNNTGIELTIIGQPTINGRSYFEQCKKEAGRNITFTEYIPLHTLLEYFRKAKVHVLPSWFETTGLSSLEAAAMGCNVVITRKGDTEEYFGDKAFYCDPGDVASIREAILKAHAAPVDGELEEWVRQHFTWRKAAEKTFEAYKMLQL